MEVIAIGSTVTLADDIDAIVTAVCIRGNGITYECSWWNGRSRCSEWLSDCEIKVKPATVNRIGFGCNGHSPQTMGVRQQ